MVVAPLGHSEGESVIVDGIASTCKEQGYYYNVVYCSECGEEISREKIDLELAEHTPSQSVVENATTSTCVEAGEYDEVVYCSVCDVEISREHKTKELGAHIPLEAVKENEISATCSDAGSYDSVVYCSVCGEELSREKVTVDPIAHIPSNYVIENATTSTCAEAGEYDEVAYCSVCGEEISREHKTKESGAHVPLEAVKENVVSATCIKGESYDAVVYCGICGDELSRESIEGDPLGHDIIHHEGKASTCKEHGCEAYDTCSRCDYSTYEELPLADHSPSTAVKEKTVASTCVKSGSYESVVYCSVCGDELSRETITTNPLGHSFTNYKYNNDATTEKDGTETAKCSRCGATDTRIKPGTRITNPTAKAKLNVAGPTALSYRTIVTIKATATNLDPAYHLVLVVNGKEIKGNNKEVSYDYGELKNDINYSVKIVDANGNIQKDANGTELKKDGGKITCNAGFFQKLIAFFQGLFGALPKKTVQP